MGYQSRKDATEFLKEATQGIDVALQTVNDTIMDILNGLEVKVADLYEKLERAELEISEQGEEIEDLEREIRQTERRGT